MSTLSQTAKVLSEKMFLLVQTAKLLSDVITERTLCQNGQEDLAYLLNNIIDERSSTWVDLPRLKLYLADGVSTPYPLVRKWMEDQIKELEKNPFCTTCANGTTDKMTFIVTVEDVDQYNCDICKSDLTHKKQ